MKFPGEAAERVAGVLLTRGPSTAADLADEMRTSQARVRRVLGQLMATGFVESHDRAPYGPAPQRRRGRPRSVFSLTAQGRAACDRADDALALEALRFMRDTYGDAAVAAFAADRAARLAAPAASVSTADAPAVLAEALTAAGYAAQVEPLGELAVQLCQHHCPVIDAAREFPVLCDAETSALGDALGRHATRLATLAHGDQVCTTAITQHVSQGKVRA